jgi:hypothetical protein
VRTGETGCAGILIPIRFDDTTCKKRIKFAQKKKIVTAAHNRTTSMQ